MKKIVLAICFITLFALLYALIYIIHCYFFRVNVVFYAALGDAFLSVLLVSALLIKFDILNIFEKMQLVIILMLLGYAFSISIPTVIDRSLSFYILEKLQQRGGKIKKDSFEAIFRDEYVREHHLVDVRLTEQLESGTIRIDDNCVQITDKGSCIAAFGRFFRKNLLPKNRLLMGSYSDILTDPFKNSMPRSNCTCE